MKEHRLRLFNSYKQKPYLPDSEVRKIARKKNALATLTQREEVNEERGLRGVHIFSGPTRDQRPNAISRANLAKERKRQSLSLAELWAKAKAELAADFALRGNQRFIDAVKKVEKSRVRKNKLNRKKKALSRGY